MNGKIYIIKNTVNGMKIRDIASKYDVDVRTVSRAKRRYNLKRT